MMTRNITIGEILLVNPKTRSAIILDETNDQFIEVPLIPMGRDDDMFFNTQESLPKEGTRVRLGYYNNDVIIEGPAPVNTLHRQDDDLRIRRKLTNVNEGEALNDGLLYDDLSPRDGYTAKGGHFFGAYDPIYRKEEDSALNYAGNSFDDAMPGDKITATKDGNAIGVLEGGINYFKASDLCQIIGIRYNDLLRVISRNYEHFSDFGNITIKNEDGATNFVLEGSASQTETQAGRFTLRMEIGNSGDIFKISVFDGSGSVASVFHMKADGEIYTYCQKETKIIRGESKEIVYGRKRMDYQGKYYNEYKDDYGNKIKGSENREILNNQIISVQQDKVQSVSRNLTESVGGTKTENIFGSLTAGNANKEEIFVGNKDETIVTTGNFNRETSIGSFLRSILVSGDFEDSTLLGNFSRFTSLGDFEDTTISGSFTRTTQLGDFTDETVSGNMTRTTSLGDITDETTSGDILRDTLNGKFYVSAGGPGLYNTIELKQSGGIEIIDAFNNKVEMTATGIKVSEALGGTLNLSTSKVALGISGVELLNLINQIIVQIDLTETAIIAHNHATVVGPTTPPVNAAAFAAIKVSLAAIQTQLVSITGTV